MSIQGCASRVKVRRVAQRSTGALGHLLADEPLGLAPLPRSTASALFGYVPRTQLKGRSWPLVMSAQILRCVCARTLVCVRAHIQDQKQLKAHA